MPIIIDHTHPTYRALWNVLEPADRYNGSLYYSQEIVKNIIPNVNTKRNWITVNTRGAGCDNAIVFIHNNLKPELYSWLKEYNNLILVCGVPETIQKVKHLGKAIYLPLSIDLDQVKRHKRAKDKGIAFVGRPSKKTSNLPAGVDYLEGMPRNLLLSEMARYRYIYAVGRCAIEAKALGCKVLAYDDRYPNPDRWKVMSNKRAAKILQEKIDKIDGL